ncbi:Tetratricopeptide repeat protein [Candidatus Magnetomoraceae bacterium gMMP-1]
MKKIIILSICAFIAAISFNILDKQIYPLVLREEVRVVPQKEVIDFLCLDHRGFASDLLFIQVNLHSGSLMWKPLKFGFDSDWTYQTMDLITDLDPKYYTAYLFAAMGLIHNFDDVKLARPILEKGMRIFPKSWELPFWLGYDYYVYFQDYETAGKYLWQAANKPDAPTRFFALLLSTLKKGGAYEKGAWILKKMLNQTGDKRLKTVYEKKLIQLENLAFLQKSVHIFLLDFARFPVNLNELVKEHIISKIPDDPVGMTYKWDKETERVIMKKTNRKRTN